MAEIKEVAAKGLAVIDQEVEMGLRSIAVPLVNARGQTVAALNIRLSTSNADLEEMQSRLLPAFWALQKELRVMPR